MYKLLLKLNMKLTIFTTQHKKMKCLHQKAFHKTKKFQQAFIKIINLKCKKIINLINNNNQIRRKNLETNKLKIIQLHWKNQNIQHNNITHSNKSILNQDKENKKLFIKILIKNNM
jgi:hypothetical protein